MRSFRSEIKKVLIKSDDYEKSLENSAIDLIQQLKTFCQTYGDLLFCLDQLIYKPKFERTIVEYAKKLVEQEISNILLEK